MLACRSSIWLTASHAWELQKAEGSWLGGRPNYSVANMCSSHGLQCLIQKNFPSPPVATKEAWQMAVMRHRANSLYETETLGMHIYRTLTRLLWPSSGRAYGCLQHEMISAEGSLFLFVSTWPKKRDTERDYLESQRNRRGAHRDTRRFQYKWSLF